MTRLLTLAVPNEVLSVGPGEKIRVTTEWNYVGPAISGEIYTAIYYPTTLDPHNEIAKAEKAFSLSDTPPPGVKCTGFVDIIVPSGFSGSNFGLYTKLIGLPGADLFTPFYDNVIEIVGGVSEFSNLRITSYVKV